MLLLLISTLQCSETFSPLGQLKNIDLYFNPKLFQPGSDCVPPISLAFDVLENSEEITNIGESPTVIVSHGGQSNMVTTQVLL